MIDHDHEIPEWSDISFGEAKFWWDVPEFRVYRANRKFRTNQLDPWPSDRGLVEEFQGFYPEFKGAYRPEARRAA